MSTKSKNRLLANMLSYAVLQMVNLLVGLFLPGMYRDAYGPEVNGVISTINSFITYFSYLEAGLGLTLIHSLFKPLAEEDTESTSGILSYSKKQYQKISYIYFALVVVLSLVFPLFKATSALGRGEFVTLVFVIGIYGAFDFYTMAKYRVLLTADRKEYVISNAMVFAQLLRFIFVWLLLRFNISVVLVKIVPILTLFVRSIILKIYVKRKYPRLSFSAPMHSAVSASKDRWDALLLQISISTSMALPTIIVSQVMGYTEADIFTEYCLVTSAMIAVVSALSSGVSPMLGKSIAKGENISHTYNVYDCVVSIVLAIVFSVTAIMIIPFIIWHTRMLPEINYAIPTYAIMFCIWAALYSYRIPVTAVINAAGIYRPNRWHNSINLIIQIVAGIIAALVFGVPGLLAVMIIAAIHRNVSLSAVNSRELLHNSISKCIVRQVAIALVILISFLIAYKPVMNAITGVGSWILWAAIVAAAESVVCVGAFLVVDYKTIKGIVLMARNKIKRTN